MNPVAQLAPLAHERALLRGTVVPYAAGQSLAGWYPVTLDASGAEPVLAWRYLGQRLLSAAFFQDNFSALEAADMRVCYTPLGALAQFDAVDDAGQSDGLCSLRPGAFVFHVSRCGSTLVTQMLSQLPSCVALSEPPVLDAFFRVLHARPQCMDAPLIFRQLIAALGQKRRASEAHLVVKLDCWHAPWMSWVRQVYPHVPLHFLYREPQQVLDSHTRQRGLQMVPGMLPLGPLQLTGQMQHAGDLDGYAQQVLGAIFRTAVDLAGANGLQLLNYSQLPKAVWAELMPALGIACDAEGLQAVQNRGQFHAKHGSTQFVGDPKVDLPARSGPASQELATCYAALEAQRLQAGLAVGR
jgi:hypothetical protein